MLRPQNGAWWLSWQERFLQQLLGRGGYCCINGNWYTRQSDGWGKSSKGINKGVTLTKSVKRNNGGKSRAKAFKSTTVPTTVSAQRRDVERAERPAFVDSTFGVPFFDSLPLREEVKLIFGSRICVPENIWGLAALLRCVRCY